MTLSKKLSIFYLLIAVIPLAAVGTIAYENGRNTIEKQTINHLFSTNILKKAELDAWLADKTQHIEIVANIIFFRQRISRAMALHESENGLPGNEIEEIQERFLVPFLHGGEYFELFVMSPEDGHIFVSTENKQIGKLKTRQPFFLKGKKETFIQNVYYSMSLRKPAMTVSTPIRDEDGSLIAVLAGRVDLSPLSEIMGRRSSLLKTEDTYLVNKFNFFITEPLYGDDYALKKSTHTTGVQLALGHNNGFAFYNDYREVPVIGAYQWIPEWELGLLTEVDQSEAYASIYALRNTTALFGLGIACIAAAIGLIIAKTITKPLGSLAHRAREIGQGDLETEIIISDQGEIGNLARTLEQMRAELKESLVSRDELTREVRRRRAAMTDLERSNKELEQFAYVASHDLQEPLRMVASYTQLLAQRYENQLDDKAHKYIGYAVEGATRMQGLVNDLLQLSRVGTRGKPFEKTDSSQVLQSVLKNLEKVIEETQAEIHVAPLPMVMADPMQLGQIFQNLIENAVKFRGENKPEITVSATVNNGDCTFQVKDNGIGIDPMFHERIFTIFQRLHERGKYEGSGIGLAIAKKIVERHGGRIWIESAEGEGSVFLFTFPCH